MKFVKMVCSSLFAALLITSVPCKPFRFNIVFNTDPIKQGIVNHPFIAMGATAILTASPLILYSLYTSWSNNQACYRKQIHEAVNAALNEHARRNNYRVGIIGQNQGNDQHAQAPDEMARIANLCKNSFFIPDRKLVQLVSEFNEADADPTHKRKLQDIATDINLRMYGHS